MGFEINDKRVETSIRRYVLIQEYDSQDNSKRAVKKRMKKRFGNVKKRVQEIIMEKLPSMVDQKCVSVVFRACTCGGRNKEHRINVLYLERLEDGSVVKRGKNYLFHYCLDCGKSQLDYQEFNPEVL